VVEDSLEAERARLDARPVRGYQAVPHGRVVGLNHVADRVERHLQLP
jgi:hypothetical protein